MPHRHFLQHPLVPALTYHLLMVGMAGLCMPASQALLAADNEALPSWRTGVSRWTGSQYALPEHAALPTHVGAVDATPKALPYTVPTDPAKVQANPYSIGAAEVDRPTSIQLTPAEPDVNAMDSSPPRPDALVEKSSEPAAAPAITPRVTEQGDESVADKPTLPGPAMAVTAPAPAKELASPLAKAAAGAPLVEAAPLESEVIRWYEYPRRWMRGWDSHAEFGLDGSNGNADTLAIQTGLELKRKTDLSTFEIDVDYRQASNSDSTIEDNGRFDLSYDRLFLDSPWSGFGKFALEWDKFKSFDLRVILNGGIGYHWIRRDDATLVTRLGAGASQEIGAPDDDWIAEAVFGIDAERQLTSRQKLKGQVEYYPAWEDFGDFRLVSDVAWEILLDDSENLSLKLAATDRYDSTPQGAKANDIYYSLLLLYKF